MGKPENTSSPWPRRIGWILTLVWLAFFATYLVVARADILSLEPNELGDFLAGMFAPLAFVWIIVGYYQQAIELRLQVAELTEQVKATQQLAREAKVSARQERAGVQPVFAVLRAERVKGNMHVEIRNSGWVASSLRVRPLGNLKVVDQPPRVVNSHERFLLVLLGDRGEVALEYVDGHGAERSARLRITPGTAMVQHPFAMPDDAEEPS